MIIRSYTPDYSYIHPARQNDPYELIGIESIHEHYACGFLVENTPHKVAFALEALADAIRRRWPE